MEFFDELGVDRSSERAPQLLPSIRDGEERLRDPEDLAVVGVVEEPRLDPRSAVRRDFTRRCVEAVDAFDSRALSGVIAHDPNVGRRIEAERLRRTRIFEKVTGE